jgi:putative membrane protein|tara:strand:- start:312 stop:743 length:432 start_codon:yes stop_codon:yes gene_type:complete
MSTYLTFKSLHLIAVISWMAGLLYLPRIFVYHAENETNNDIKSVFKIMEHKLFFYIMTPAMLASWVFGILLIYVQSYETFSFWLAIKLILVIILTFYHFLLLKWLIDFKKDSNSHSGKFFRYMNEVPTILLIIIIFVVVFKPL